MGASEKFILACSGAKARQAPRTSLSGQYRPRRSETTSSNSPTKYMCERGGEGGMVNGSQIILFLLKVKLKMLARVAWNKERAASLPTSAYTCTLS